MKGIETNNIHLFATIRWKQQPTGLEIYFADEQDIFKIEKISKPIINGILLYEEKYKNLKMVGARFIEGKV